MASEFREDEGAEVVVRLNRRVAQRTLARFPLHSEDSRMFPVSGDQRELRDALRAALSTPPSVVPEAGSDSSPEERQKTWLELRRERDLERKRCRKAEGRLDFLTTALKGEVEERIKGEKRMREIAKQEGDMNKALGCGGALEAYESVLGLLSTQPISTTTKGSETDG